MFCCVSRTWSFKLHQITCKLFMLTLYLSVYLIFRFKMASQSFRDYFCNYCGSLLCLSTSQFITRESIYQSSNIQMQCIQCNQRYRESKALSNTGFVPLRQILKAEIIRDSEQWANASTTTERCPKCSNEKAYYLQVQTRSADEPMTTYYRCTKCAHNWSER